MLMSALRGQLMAVITDFVIGYQRTLEFRTSNDLKVSGNEISISFLLVISSTYATSALYQYSSIICGFIMEIFSSRIHRSLTWG
jgi:hypothetical protein